MKKTVISIISVIIFCVFLALSAYCFIEKMPETAAETEEKTIQIENDINNIEKNNSALILIVGSVLTTVVPVLAIVKRNLNSIIALVKSKATTEEVGKALINTKEEIASTFNDCYFSILKQLEEERESTKKLTIMLSVFMNNIKINPNAKSEIMKIVSGIKDISGNTADVIEEINKTIEKANKSEKIPRLN